MIPRGHVFAQIARQCLIEMASGIGAFIESMSTVRVDDLGELLVMVHEFSDQHLAVLVVTVVIARAIDQQEIALELVRERDG